MKTNIHFWSYVTQFFLEWEMFQTKVVEKFKTLFSFRISCGLEITWKNIIERVRSQIKTWRMRLACWITRAANTHSGYIKRIAFPLQHWLQKSASVSRNMYMYLPCSGMVVWCYRSSVTIITKICLLEWKYLSAGLFCKITDMMTVLSYVLTF